MHSAPFYGAISSLCHRAGSPATVTLNFFRGKQSRGTARIHGDQRSLCPPLNLLHWERLDDRPRRCSSCFFHISRAAAASPHVPPSCALEAVIDIRVYGERTIFHLAVHHRLGCIISTYCTSSCLVRHAALELLRFTTQIAPSSSLLLYLFLSSIICKC